MVGAGLSRDVIAPRWRIVLMSAVNDCRLANVDFALTQNVRTNYMPGPTRRVVLHLNRCVAHPSTVGTRRAVPPLMSACPPHVRTCTCDYARVTTPTPHLSYT